MKGSFLLKLISIYILISLNYLFANGYDILDLNENTNATIQLDLNPSSTVYFGNKKILITGKESKGLILENVPLGRNIIKVKTRSFKPQAWPIDIKKGIYLNLSAEEDVTVDDTSINKIRFSTEYSQNKLSLYEYNKIKKELREKSKYRIIMGINSDLGSGRRYQKNNVSEKSVKVYDEVGVEHTLTFKSIIDGKLKVEKKTGMLSAWQKISETYHCDFIQKLFIYFDGKEVDRLKKVFYAFNKIDQENYKNSFNGIRKEIKKLESFEKVYDIYPIKIRITNISEKEWDKNSSHRSDSQCSRALDIIIETKSSF
ncbi:hypothetical protein [Halarcobacter sp.]|uniref:hypothetical protein n=1 Tax=Halarcobacter sp. TaxID=2321133 RepID=UPI002AABF8DE|nr:hypothetical protein [Halarcobacter sp.]